VFRGQDPRRGSWRGRNTIAFRKKKKNGKEGEGSFNCAKKRNVSPRGGEKTHLFQKKKKKMTSKKKEKGSRSGTSAHLLPQGKSGLPPAMDLT